MEVGTEDELELKLIRANENELFFKMSEILMEDHTTTVIDLPGTAQLKDHEESEVGMKEPGPVQQQQFCSHLPSCGCEAWEQEIPCYLERLKECVQKDMIALGGPLQEQGYGCLRDPYEQEKVLKLKMNAAFQRAEIELLEALKRRKGAVQGQYGLLTEAAERPCAHPGPRWQVEWSRRPQPVEVRVRCLRAVRDKLPEGRYAVRVALLSHLGGRALRWSGLQPHLWTDTTEPAVHGGHVFDTELLVEQSLFTAVPCASIVLPSMALQFELLLLPGDHSHVSGVVAWGAFPACDCAFNAVQGRFRTPMLRGRPHPALDQYRKVEEAISSDLDSWLCNLYFQVKKLPHSWSGEEITAECSEEPGSSSSGGPTRGSPPSSTSGGPTRGSPPSSPAPSRHASATDEGKDSNHAVLQHTEQSSDSVLLKAETGMRYKKDGADRATRPAQCEGESPLALQTGRADRRSSLLAHELEGYTFSLQAQQSCGSRRPGGRAAERARFSLRMLPSELGLSRWRRAELALITPLLALIWFARLYLHYCSQWLFLQAMAVPVNKFQFRLYTVELVYQNSLLHTREELAMVVVGPLTLNAATLLLVLIRWGCQLMFGSFPSFLSKFIMALGVWTLLDPLAVFAVDAILGRLAYSADRPIADAAKLAWHFHRTEQSQVPGVLITLFLYLVHFICSFTVLYMYFLRLHNDGRMLDIFQRLHSEEGLFFVPQDLEVSNQELNYTVKKAEQWRGFNGERRKVAVYDYIWTEDPSARSAPSSSDPPAGAEASTHVSVYTLHLSGYRELYRQFLRQPDGAIVEVIGDVAPVDPSRDMATGLAQGPEDKAEMCTSQHLRKRRKRKAPWRSHRVGPAGRTCDDSAAGQKP